MFACFFSTDAMSAAAEVSSQTSGRSIHFPVSNPIGRPMRKATALRMLAKMLKPTCTESPVRCSADLLRQASSFAVIFSFGRFSIPFVSSEAMVSTGFDFAKDATPCSIASRRSSLVSEPDRLASSSSFCSCRTSRKSSFFRSEILRSRMRLNTTPRLPGITTLEGVGSRAVARAVAESGSAIRASSAFFFHLASLSRSASSRV
mmetsp:Transcript_47751/g.113635  ORF Transcript_47751/g.113635 Transcript_47751/m.113635 type:complete len:204 (+) Transcript_47751:559-1170(+)